MYTASVDERALRCSEDEPLIGWRLFRVRRSPAGFVLSAPMIHNPDFETFLSPTIEATCYEHDHAAPASGCRCGLYAVVEGTLDSLRGYLHDTAHDDDPHIYAEVACTGLVFIDARGVRSQRIEVLRLATSGSHWPDAAMHERACADLSKRYGVKIWRPEVLPPWVVTNELQRGAPHAGDIYSVDLDALLAKLGRQPTGTG